MSAAAPLPGPGGAPTALSRLPAVDRLLAQPALAAAAAAHGARLVKRAAQEVLAATRERLRAAASDRHAASAEADGLDPVPSLDDLTAAALARLDAARAPRLRRVINLSGTVIHTNLGRALLGEEAIAAVAAAMRSYAALEYDLAHGERGDRDAVVDDLLRELTGAQAATVVNNNAAAVLLALAALGGGRQALISRGELIEIGGAFRMPDIMRAAGCKLVEVGTTNRTHPRDFESALGPKTGLLVKAHWSNYAITGFTASVDDATLAGIAHAHGVPYFVDLGAGALVDLSAWGLPREPLPQDALAAGADVVSFSGDKLLGGPQAGILVGTAAAIGRIKKHPLKRALRCSKLTLAALEATLRVYASGHRLPERLPTVALLARRRDDIRAACVRVQPALAAWLGSGFTVSIADCASQIGSGSLPVDRLESCALRLQPAAARGAGRALAGVAERLRALPVPVIGRIHDDALWLDARCLGADDEAQLLAQLPAPAPADRA